MTEVITVTNTGSNGTSFPLSISPCGRQYIHCHSIHYMLHVCMSVCMMYAHMMYVRPVG